jgi:hypothetical protein
VIYDIEWLDAARQELAAIWQMADSAAQAATMRAIGRINDRLAIAPYTQGETRPPDDMRLMFELPLRVTYRIERFQGAVVVLHVRLIGKRPRT